MYLTAGFEPRARFREEPWDPVEEEEEAVCARVVDDAVAV